MKTAVLLTLSITVSGPQEVATQLIHLSGGTWEALRHSSTGIHTIQTRATQGIRQIDLRPFDGTGLKPIPDSELHIARSTAHQDSNQWPSSLGVIEILSVKAAQSEGDALFLV